MDRELVEILERKNPDGSFTYTDDDLLAIVPQLVLGIARALPDAELPEFAMRVLGEAAARAGIQEGLSPDEVSAAWRAYYEAHPLPKQLTAELERVLRGALDAGGADAARALAGVIGATAKAGPLDSGARPEGTIPAGPAARFAAMRAQPPKKK